MLPIPRPIIPSCGFLRSFAAIPLRHCNSEGSCKSNKIFAAKERKENKDKSLWCFFFALQSVRITHNRKDLFAQNGRNERKSLCPQNTQNTQKMKNGIVLSVSASFCVFCGQIQIRLRLAALRSM